jgi:hypothetical protein
MTRTTPYNASLSRELTRYRIERKIGNRWQPIRIGGKIIPFHTKEEAERVRVVLR